MRKARFCLSGCLVACLLLAPLAGAAAPQREGTSWLERFEGIAREVLGWVVGNSDDDDPAPDPQALPDFDPDGAALTRSGSPESPPSKALPDFDPDG